MRRKPTSKIRTLPVLWPAQESAWESPINGCPSGPLLPESYFIGMLGLGASLAAASLPPIILTPKTSQKHELEQT